LQVNAEEITAQIRTSTTTYAIENLDTNGDKR